MFINSIIVGDCKFIVKTCKNYYKEYVTSVSMNSVSISINKKKHNNITYNFITKNFLEATKNHLYFLETKFRYNQFLIGGQLIEI